MTILSICQNVLEEIGLTAPTSILGNTDDTAVRVLAAAQVAGKRLHRKHNWVALVTEYTFSTVVDQPDYALPSDFGWLENQTLWDRTNYEKIRGPLSAQDWQNYKSSVLATSATIWSRYRLRNVSGTVKFSLHPTPDAIVSQVFEYVSTNWCESSVGTGQASWQADADVGLIDEYLIERETKWRLLRSLGFTYDKEEIEAVEEFMTAKGRDGSAPVLSLETRRGPHFIGPADVPDTGYGT